MKKILIILLLVVTNSVFGQSRIEKYNNILKRYEYFEDNTLVGYKKYNDVMNQWEYTDLTSKNNAESQPYRSPYRDLEPVETYDATTAYQVLAAKEARYDEHVAQIRKLIDDLTYKIEDFSDPEKKKMAYRRWTNFIEAFNGRTELIDYSSSRTTQKVMNYMIDGFNKIVAETARTESIQVTESNSSVQYNETVKSNKKNDQISDEVENEVDNEEILQEIEEVSSVIKKNMPRIGEKVGKYPKLKELLRELLVEIQKEIELINSGVVNMNDSKVSQGILKNFEKYRERLILIDFQIQREEAKDEKN